MDEKYQRTKVETFYCRSKKSNPQSQQQLEKDSKKHYYQEFPPLSRSVNHPSHDQRSNNEQSQEQPRYPEKDSNNHLHPEFLPLPRLANQTTNDQRSNIKEAYYQQRESIQPPPPPTYAYPNSNHQHQTYPIITHHPANINQPGPITQEYHPTSNPNPANQARHMMQESHPYHPTSIPVNINQTDHTIQEYHPTQNSHYANNLTYPATFATQCNLPKTNPTHYIWNNNPAPYFPRINQ